jgi:hypothetical protein
MTAEALDFKLTQSFEEVGVLIATARLTLHEVGRGLILCLVADLFIFPLLKVPCSVSPDTEKTSMLLALPKGAKLTSISDASEKYLAMYSVASAASASFMILMV